MNAEGDFKRVLCVCTANMLRSPTAAVVLANEPFNYNTRSAGVHASALIPVTTNLLYWCEEIVCMQHEHLDHLVLMLNERGLTRPIVLLAIPDDYDYRSPQLMALIAERYQSADSRTAWRHHPGMVSNL
jgi:predicted protein tyrosine phosphatase